MLRAVGGKKHKTSEMLSVLRPEDGCCIPVLGACGLRQPSLACLVLYVCVARFGSSVENPTWHLFIG